MRYTNGNNEAFARPRKPAGVDNKNAYIVGAGLAGLSAAVFLIRDGQMPGKNIHIFEELSLSGGSLDGKFTLTKKAQLREATIRPQQLINPWVAAGSCGRILPSKAQSLVALKCSAKTYPKKAGL